MSSKSTKKLRAEFEKKYGFTADMRNLETYKSAWRKWKKEAK